MDRPTVGLRDFLFMNKKILQGEESMEMAGDEIINMLNKTYRNTTASLPTRQKSEPGDQSRLTLQTPGDNQDGCREVQTLSGKVNQFEVFVQWTIPTN